MKLRLPLLLEPRWAPILAPLLVAVLADCSSGAGSSATSFAGSGGAAIASGRVMGGQQPVAGATVNLYAAGSPAGSAPALVATAMTDANGGFSIATIDCPSPTSPMYYVVSGGNAGAGSNSALVLMAAVGLCHSIPAFTNVSELTTAAAAYAMAQFLGATGSGTTLADASAISGASLGLTTAMNRALNLTNVATGTLGSALPPAASCAGSGAPLNCVAAETLDSLADAVASCVNSAGPSSSGCATLFCVATPGASFNSGSQTCSIAALPTDTLQAALSIALHPGMVSGAGVFSLVGSTPVFVPTLATAPNDWSLALNFTGGGLSSPEAVALDAMNQLWVANYNDVVAEFDAQGVPVSATGYSGGGLEESFGIAVAPNGDIWVTNEQSASANSGHGTLTLLSPSGSILSGATGYGGGGLDFPVAIAIDASGNAWVADNANASVSSFSSSGVASSGTGYMGSGLGFPSGIAVDGSDNIWVSNTSSNAVTELNSSGGILSGTAGYTGGGLDGPSAIALDAQNNAWVSNFYGESVTLLNANGQPSSGSPYTAGGFASPAGVAIDGAGSVWVTNYHGPSLTELTGANTATPGAALSPSTGFTGGGLSLPFNPAIDQAGNVWVGNAGNDSITEFVGIAAPVRTPIAGLPLRP